MGRSLFPVWKQVQQHRDSQGLLSPLGCLQGCPSLLPAPATAPDVATPTAVLGNEGSGAGASLQQQCLAQREGNLCSP